MGGRWRELLVLVLVVISTASSQGPAGMYPLAGSHLLHERDERLREVAALSPQSNLAFPQSIAAWNFSIGSKHAWYAYNFASNTDYLTNSTCRAVGVHCYIFVEDSLWNTRITQANVDSIETVFDVRVPSNSTKGVFQMDVDAFGNPPDVDNDPRIIILVMDIKDGYAGSGGFVAGYFSSANEYSRIIFPQSNVAEIYYLDGNPLDLSTSWGFRTGMSTTAHEFQHMIHFNYDPAEVTFVNEGCSLVAEVNCGYPIYDQTGYVNETNHALLDWRSSDINLVQHDYSRAARFTTYLRDQFGMPVFKPIVASTLHGIPGIDAGLKAFGTTRRFAGIFPDWLTANDADDRTVDPAYGYLYQGLPKAVPWIYTAPAVGLTSEVLPALSARYISYRGGSNLRATFTTTADSMMIRAVERGGSMRVLPVSFGTEFYEPAFGSTYATVDFVVMNTAKSASASYSFQSTGDVTSVAQGSSASLVPAELTLDQNYPNPWNPSTVIRYHLPHSGSVNLRLFNVLGEDVRDYDFGWQGAGTHEVRVEAADLPAGAYYYHLTAAGEVRTKKFLLVK